MTRLDFQFGIALLVREGTTLGAPSRNFPNWMVCCSWISDDPETIRREGIRGRWTKQRLGGLSAIHQAWEGAAEEFGGKIDAALEREVKRRQRIRDHFLQRDLRHVGGQRELTFTDPNQCIVVTRPG